jgi:hypothetical protein
MGEFFYDLHIHSCLSPCGDGDMTPANIAGMASLKELDVIALTDHNTCRNCRAAMKSANDAGLLLIPGMELCTSEEIHVVCLFDTLEGAEAFGAEVYRALPDIRNRPDIFGEQVIMGEDDEPAGTEPKLLINATSISIGDAAGLAAKYGGAAFPAHIDKPSNGAIGVLGAFPCDAGFAAAELSPNSEEKTFTAAHPETAGLKILRDSDAHYLWQISERVNSLSLPELTRAVVTEYIKRQKKTI